jgi:hypothetical protein
MTEKPLRFERMSGLDEEQLSELECRATELLEEPWDKEEGRPRELTLREALVVTCGYMRQNIVEDVWADIFDVDQSTISRYITFPTPFVEKATEEDRPAAEDAAEATRDAIALGRRHVVAMLVLGRREQAVVGEIQDHGTRIPGCRESAGPHNIRLRACYRQPARHGETGRIRC